MGLLGENKKKVVIWPSWFGFCSLKSFSMDSCSSSSSQKNKAEMQAKQRKPGGWKAMPFILGNETFERLATIALVSNFMMFLLNEFHMEQVEASNVINLWSGFLNFSPLIGAFLSDAYVGRFFTIAFASFASLLGMFALTLIAWIPQLHPPPCNVFNQCKNGATALQFGVLIMALGFLIIGTGGIRPCSLPFGIDQFDSTTDEGRKGINSFFNWYYATFTVILILVFTVVVYIQTVVGWVWGFGIPTILMLCSILLFFYGTKLYVHVKPEGSVFSGIAQVLVAAYKKRKLKVASNEFSFYDPPTLKGTLVTKLPLTNQLRCLNKAAIIQEGEVEADGSPSNKWRLSSIQRVEEVKCLVKVIPVWASGIICFIAIVQQGTFTVSQALKMDRHLGSKFEIPAGSLAVISMITLGIWIPIYDRIIVPSLRKVTKLEEGITLLQRIGIGIAFSFLSMVAAGLVERMRRNSAIAHARPDGIAPISVMWLAPQLILMGFAEAFNIIGQLEFYNKEFPENMSSVANSLFCVTAAGANYFSSVIVTVVHKVTGNDRQPDWLTKDINAGKIDYFYYLIAVMGFQNMIYFIWVSRKYHYKISTTQITADGDKPAGFDVEPNAIKQ